MSELSPAAQAVFWAFNSKFDWIEDGVPGSQCKAIAAALRAVADQVAPESYDCAIDDRGWVYGAEYRNTEIRWQILAIANELEAQ